VQNRAKFGVGIGVIVVALAFLAWLGYGESKTYYHTIAEYQTLSIKHGSGRVDFTLEEQGKMLPVSYVGSDPLPDTFVDKSQALVEGRPGADGRFVAEHVQAKCASKYEAAPGGDKPAPSGVTQRSSM